MAVLYGDKPARGLSYTAIGQERFQIAAPRGVLPEGQEEIDNETLASIPLVMPIRQSFARLMVERACEMVGRSPNITVEVFSITNLLAALEAGCGATVVPVQVAESLGKRTELEVRPLPDHMSMQLSMCIPDSEGLSDAAFEVHQILDRLVRGRPQLKGAA
jgi:LysR family nitrogen assimilation transcriptional regulator